MGLDRAWYNALVDDDGSNAVGTVWGKDDVNNFIVSIDALHSGYCLNRQSANANVPNATWTTLVSWDVREADPLGMYVGGGIVRVPAAGVYGVSAFVLFGSGVGLRYFAVAINGVPYPNYPGGLAAAGGGQATFARMHEVLSLATAAQLSIMVYQDSGAPLPVLADTRFQVWRIA